MQCINCGFENMPASMNCAQCQSRLMLDDICVVPARASALRLKTRFFKMRHLTERSLGGIGRVLSRVAKGLRLAIPEHIDWRAIAWTVIPGLGHRRSGQRRLGTALLVTWIVCLVLGLLTFPSDWYPWFVAGMVTVHSLAFISLMAPNLNYEGFIIRALFGVLLYVILSRFVYGALGSFGQNYFVGFALPPNMPAIGPVQGGDGIIAEGRWLHSTPYQRGDWVFYSTTQASGIVVRKGTGLDQIIAVPGDTLKLSREGITVNGGLPEDVGDFQQMMKQLSAESSFVLLEGEYAIAPRSISVNMHGHPRFDPYYVQALIVRTQDTILGRPVLRTWPWSRFGFLNRGA